MILEELFITVETIIFLVGVGLAVYNYSQKEMPLY